jgi:hypothetical protein
MTYYFSYIGDPEVPPFQWDEPDAARYRIGNLPQRVLPQPRTASLGIAMFEVMRLTEEGVYEGRQIDWGAWALRMTGRQLRDFFADHPENSRLVATLESDRVYLLVAAEGV